MWYEWLFLGFVLASITIALILTSFKIKESEQREDRCSSTCDFGIILSVNLGENIDAFCCCFFFSCIFLYLHCETAVVQPVTLELYFHLIKVRI